MCHIEYILTIIYTSFCITWAFTLFNNNQGGSTPKATFISSNGNCLKLFVEGAEFGYSDSQVENGDIIWVQFDELIIYTIKWISVNPAKNLVTTKSYNIFTH